MNDSKKSTAASQPGTSTSEASARRPVLVLEDLTFRETTRQSLAITGANLSIAEGEVVALRIPPSTESRPFTSMLQGLRTPQQGRVLFDQHGWDGDDHRKHDGMRSQIGRVFDGVAWVENLNIHENVVLRLRHHTNRSLDDIDREVQLWADRFEITRVTDQRPAFVGKTYLRICEWIRAFIGKPRLLLLEHPMRSVPLTRLPLLSSAIQTAIDRGAAVLWIGRETEFSGVEVSMQMRQFHVTDQHLMPVGQGA